MNAYTVRFLARCPANGIHISYCLRMETVDVIRVEALTAAVHGIGEGFHEAIADDLARRFGGRQTLTAEHHGVHIETTRAP